MISLTLTKETHRVCYHMLDIKMERSLKITFPFNIIQYITLKTHQLFKIDHIVMKSLISFMDKGDI